MKASVSAIQNSFSSGNNRAILTMSMAKYPTTVKMYCQIIIKPTDEHVDLEGGFKPGSDSPKGPAVRYSASRRSQHQPLGPSKGSSVV